MEIEKAFKRLLIKKIKSCMKIAVIDHESHTLYVEDISDEILEGQYGGDEQLYIDDTYNLGEYSWDYIIDTQYIPEYDKTPVGVNFKDLCD